MLTGFMKNVGGLIGDAVEVLKSTAEELQNVPQALQDGYEEGLLISVEKEPECQTDVCIKEGPKVEGHKSEAPKTGAFAKAPAQE